MVSQAKIEGDRSRFECIRHGLMECWRTAPPSAHVGTWQRVVRVATSRARQATVLLRAGARITSVVYRSMGALGRGRRIPGVLHHHHHGSLSGACRHPPPIAGDSRPPTGLPTGLIHHRQCPSSPDLVREPLPAHTSGAPSAPANSVCRERLNRPARDLVEQLVPRCPDFFNHRVNFLVASPCRYP